QSSTADHARPSAGTPPPRPTLASKKRRNDRRRPHLSSVEHARPSVGVELGPQDVHVSRGQPLVRSVLLAACPHLVVRLPPRRPAAQCPLPTRSRSDLRPAKYNHPSASRYARSPLQYQPSRTRSAVASSLL